MWIKGQVLFPQKVKIFRISKPFLDSVGLSDKLPKELTDDILCFWLEAIFLKVKELDYIPADSQLQAAGLRQNYNAVFISITSNEFEPVVDGEKIPEEVLVWKDRGDN